MRLVIGTYVASRVSDSWMAPWNDTWSPVHTESSPRASTRRTSSNCSAGGLSESDVVGQDAHAEQVALAIEVLDLIHADALGRGALPPDLLRPELRVLEDG